MMIEGTEGEANGVAKMRKSENVPEGYGWEKDTIAGIRAEERIKQEKGKVKQDKPGYESNGHARIDKH